jgi:hypothetical protein
MDIRNPIYTKDGQIDCEINHPIYGWVPFTADQNDIEDHGRKIYNKALAMSPAEYVESPQSVLFDVEIRSKRNSLLYASDWTQVADAPVDKTAWATYRQALRDITSQEGFPENVVWPIKPE